ncbi:MAG: Hydrogenase maturation factor HypB [Phycisphaerae bacterium]|nr:Hydrogenase maturation factor HypB [Phycisphaerae bacterium]
MNKVQVIESVLKANDAVARANRHRLHQQGILSLNIMSAPGSGKTSLLEQTISHLPHDCRSAVLVGDLQTSRDAERLSRLISQVTQINTGSGCHLSAAMVADGLDSLDLTQVDILFIENVGNMVCPAAHDLGEDARVVLLSLPEGDDKVAKYPTLFQPADVILLNKMDLLEILGFDCGSVRADLSKINTRAPLIPISCRSGVGLDEWLRWLTNRINTSSVE